MTAEEGAALEEQQQRQSGDGEKKRKRIQLVKIALPHVCLYVLLVLYLLAGAWAFARVEHNAERFQQAKKLERISEVYELIAAEMSEECGLRSPAQQFLFREGVFTSLSHISKFFEGAQFELDSRSGAAQLDKVLPPRWNGMSSILYALSILTTTGYGPATPMTALGQWLSIGYGLIGIPLTVLAAVDIGRFLSDVVLRTYDKILRTTKRVSVLCGVGQRRNQVISHVETKALKSLNRLQQSTPMIPFAKTKKGHNHRGRRSTVDTPPGKIVSAVGEDGAKKPAVATAAKRRLPLSVNAAILLLFCMLGGLVYIAAAGSDHNFIEGFFVTFNLVANLTMSEMPTDISHLMTLVYIFVFVTFGLAVLSMCADLAASELKWMFLKIHYFGRKINWAKRRAAKKQAEQMEFEVKELLKIIDAIREKYPDKQEISSLDILKYVQELNGGNEDGPYGGWQYRSFNMFLMHHHRRNTMGGWVPRLTFMPQSFDALKFADETDQEEEQLVSSTVNALLMNWRRQRRGEQSTFIPLLPFGV